jgi:SAM-dependent methyltransferase
MRFIDFSLATMPAYASILAQLRDPGSQAKLLDVGCCFGQDLRRLVVDGAPSTSVLGLELRPEFISLGYELFADGSYFSGEMIVGDALDDSPNGAAAILRGKVDIVHIASFLHLFDWDGQIKAGVRLVEFIKPDAANALVLGRQLGSSQPKERKNPANPSEISFMHNPESFQKLWSEIAERTGTKWEVDAWLKTVTTHSTNDKKEQWLGNNIELLQFEARRVD